MLQLPLPMQDIVNRHRCRYYLDLQKQQMRTYLQELMAPHGLGPWPWQECEPVPAHAMYNRLITKKSSIRCITAGWVESCMLLSCHLFAQVQLLDRHMTSWFQVRYVRPTLGCTHKLHRCCLLVCSGCCLHPQQPPVTVFSRPPLLIIGLNQVSS